MDRHRTAPRCQHQSCMTGFSLLASSCLCQVTPKIHDSPQHPKDPQQDIYPLLLGLPYPQSKNQHSCGGLQGLLEQVLCPHVLASTPFPLLAILQLLSTMLLTGQILLLILSLFSHSSFSYYLLTGALSVPPQTPQAPLLPC